MSFARGTRSKIFNRQSKFLLMPLLAEVDGKRRPEFDRARNANGLLEDVISSLLDLPQQAPINRGHDFRRHKRPPVSWSQVRARALKKGSRPVTFELHQLDQRIAHPALNQ